MPGAHLAVFGAGAVGLSAVTAARVAGASTIIAADVSPNRAFPGEISTEASETIKAAMKAADEVLSHPAAYRAAVATADFALAHFPRFVIYNGVNARGKNREVPHPPKWTFHNWYQANREHQS